MAGIMRNGKDKIDLIVNAGTLLTLDINDSVLYNKSIHIKDGKIFKIIDISEIENFYCDVPILKAENHIVMPGFINTHTHLAMSYFKGIAEDIPLEKWLNDYIWPVEKRCINPDFIYEASLHGIAELIKNGITFFNDMYFLPEQTLKACEDSNIRAVIGIWVKDIISEAKNENKCIYNYTKNILEKINNSPLIDYSIWVHSVYGSTEEEWKKAILLAKENSILLHTHLSETATEVKNCIKKNNKTPVSFVNDFGAFDINHVFAHGVHLQKEDFQIIKNKPCSIAMNLNSNLKLSSGILPIREYLNNNTNVSIGTDGVASNNNLSISDELSTAGKLFKTIYEDTSFLPARELVRMGTINGAKALQKQNITGSIEVGKSADMISINVNNFQCQPIYDPYSYIVYSMNKQKINNVIINGKIVLKDGALTTIDEELLLKNVYKNRKKVMSSI